MRTTETVPLFTLRSIWHRHLKETAIILAQPKCSSKGCDESDSSRIHSTGAVSHRRKADSVSGAELESCTTVPAALRSVLYKAKSYFPPHIKSIGKRAQKKNTHSADDASHLRLSLI